MPNPTKTIFAPLLFTTTILFGFILLNVSQTQADSQSITLVGQIGGATNAVAVVGDYVYVGEGSR